MPYVVGLDESRHEILTGFSITNLKVESMSMKFISFVRFMSVLGTFVLCFCVGCGTSTLKTYPVEGTVTFDGKPLDRAFVVFHPAAEEGIGAFGTTDAQGNFNLTSLRGGLSGKGAVDGNYVVTITRDKDEPSRYREDVTPNGIERVPIYDSLIPVHYGSPKESKFSATVVKEKNKIDFLLESKPVK